MSDLRSRLNKITELHGKTLAKAIGQREQMSAEACLQLEASCRSDKDLVLRFAGSDPTDGKSRTQWLVKTYIKDNQFKLEDLGRVHAALAAFERFKRKLPVEHREINHLKTLSSLEALVEPFVKAEAKARLERDLSSATGREKRRLEEWKARDESIIIQEEDGLPTIAVPMTEFASKWWGRGTKWCTASDKDNVFQEYNRDAPLVIIVCPDGAKFQMYVKKDDFQFMDNTDKKVGQETILARWNEFQSILYWAIEQNGEAFYIPEEKRNLEIYRLVVEQDGRALQYIPENYRNKLYHIAVVQNGQALQFVPKKQRSPELCRMAVEQDGNALYAVPEELRTLELCRIAVEQNGQALRYVSENKRTSELEYIAVKQNGEALHSFLYEKRTPELCSIAVQQYGLALQYVPEELRTLELCRIAVEQNGLAIKFVPEIYKIELIRLAIEQDGWTLVYVPEDDRTPELCCLAVQHYGLALEFVPIDKQTSTIYRLAIEQNGMALQYIPQELIPEFYSLAIRQNADALEYVPKELRTPELLALIPTVEPKWNLDILQGLGQQSKPLQNSQNKHQDDKELCSPAY
jgi:Domain of unknown function (DUF4116)